ncbi:DUF1059 domain-containing protein [Candidatus Woesearchaeota archaeon]|nr:DUF1059 domain-containing protein [Candidatus Woesearchaeota archaeon]
MKTMTCKQHAETFKEMAKLSKQHGMEMFQKGDEEHIKVMSKMKELMKSGKMQEWFESKKKEFNSLPDNK